MQTNKKRIKQHTLELIKAIKKIKIKGFGYTAELGFDFNGLPIDLSATNPEPLAIAYQTLKTISLTN